MKFEQAQISQFEQAQISRKLERKPQQAIASWRSNEVQACTS